MNKVLNVGTYNDYTEKERQVFVKIEYKDGNLSLSGVESPFRSGNCEGSCGQIVDNLKDYNDSTTFDDTMREELTKIWKTWHLNDMNAACEHQRHIDTSREIEVTHFKWSNKFYTMMKQAESGKLSSEDYEEYSEIYPIVHTFLFDTSESPKYTQNPIARDLLKDGWVEVKETELKSIGWISYNQHPEGLLSKPCEECGYKYGSAWLREDVPNDVIEWLESLPESPVTPAWV